jgi:hypothetical protein
VPRAPVRRKSKDWLAQNQNNVSERTTYPIGLVQSGPHHHLVES